MKAFSTMKKETKQKKVELPGATKPKIITNINLQRKNKNVLHKSKNQSNKKNMTFKTKTKIDSNIITIC